MNRFSKIILAWSQSSPSSSSPCSASSPPPPSTERDDEESGSNEHESDVIANISDDNGYNYCYDHAIGGEDIMTKKMNGVMKLELNMHMNRLNVWSQV